MFSIQHCSVAAICVADDYENHSHCDAKSQPGDTISRRVIETLGTTALGRTVTAHGLGLTPQEQNKPPRRHLLRFSGRLEAALREP
jgi:hypothetical protein